MTRSVRNFIVGGAVILLIAGWLALALRPEAVSVVLDTVELGTVEATVANTRAGTINACRRAKLAPSVGGQVKRLPVKKGDRVKRGQLLLMLWNKDLAAGVRLAESEAETAQARLKEACLLANQAERESKRLLQLQKKQLVSDEMVDQAVTEYEARTKSCEAVRASVKVSQDRIAAANAALERTVLRAPFAGVVAEVNAELGEYVTPSPPGIPTLPAIDLIDDSCLYVRAPIDEVDAPAIRTGMRARITLDALPGKYYEGRVSRIAAYVLDREKQARTVDVDVQFTKGQDTENLLAGYSADIEVVLDKREQVLRIPTEAVLEGPRVLVYEGKKKILMERWFKTGIANWKYTEVESGLEQGERVVVSVGREGVEAGVKVVPEETGQERKE